MCVARGAPAEEVARDSGPGGPMRSWGASLNLPPPVCTCHIRSLRQVSMRTIYSVRPPHMPEGGP